MKVIQHSPVKSQTKSEFQTDDDSKLLLRDLKDIKVRQIPDVPEIQFTKRHEIVRRVIPRNPLKIT